MEKNIYLAGVGGHGLQVAGKTIVAVADKMGYKTTYSPKYGYEKRGGLTSCFLVISDDDIGNPRKKIQDIILVTEPKAYVKFKDSVKKGGTLVVNSSLVTKETSSAKSITEVDIPIHDICMELGNLKIISAVILGVFACLLSDVIPNPEAIKNEMLNSLRKKPELQELNINAFYKGLEAAKNYFA